MGLQWLRLQKRFISSCLKTQHGDEERDGKKSRRGTCCCVITCNFGLKLRHRESFKKAIKRGRVEPFGEFWFRTPFV